MQSVLRVSVSQLETLRGACCTQVSRLTDVIATLEHQLAAERVRYAELLARSDAGASLSLSLSLCLSLSLTLSVSLSLWLYLCLYLCPYLCLYLWLCLACVSAA